MSNLSGNKAERLLSIDVFRGFTILMMVFVNDLASVRSIPDWMKHAAPEADAMTFVDIVFPAFLFIVGMAIPFALRSRINRGETLGSIWTHIGIRTLGLLCLGVFMVNTGGLNESLSGINRSLWSLLFYTGVILVWNQYRRYEWLRWIGVVLLVGLAAVYRSGDAAQPGWMHTSWWGILGLIGWAYLTANLVYLLFKRSRAGMVGCLALLILLFIGDRSGGLSGWYRLTDLISVGGHIGGHGSIAVAGMLAGMLFLPESSINDSKKRLKWLVIYAIMLAAGGWLLRPLYGISKVYATPAWCLYCSAICSLIMAGLYWLIDIKKITGWTFILKPAGSNPLLAYILPSIFYAGMALVGLEFWSQWLGEGLIGIFRSILFSFIILYVTHWLTRLNIRLHL
ncbi:MAG: DUF5009 domain-containing protein [Candidatus Delongbacteria bacterium]|nr:DUF5009 domain-containing protein [Candidatus Delongbacteria bacterium]